MDENMIFTQMKAIRKGTLALMDKVDETLADQIPHGFRNNIRWNLGHIYMVQENMTLGSARLHRHLPDGYPEWFNRGTSPADWTQSPPRLDELKARLAEQPDRIEAQLRGKLDQPLTQPFQLAGIEFTTVGELTNFSLFHEGMHVGAIRGIWNAANS